MNHGAPKSERELAEAKSYSRDRIAMERAEKRKLKELVQTLTSEIARLEQREESAREFVKRHPALSLIDMAEFEAFLKIPEIMDAP